MTVLERSRTYATSVRSALPILPVLPATAGHTMESNLTDAPLPIANKRE